MQFSLKRRLLSVLENMPVDRPPVICPGGMMNSAIVDIMKSSGVTFPEAHHDSELIAKLAWEVHRQTGFENFGIPFCMTVEAEVFGSTINYGSLTCEPKIAKEIFPDLASVEFQPVEELLRNGRILTVAKAAKRLAQDYPDVPVVATLTGPISLAASIVDPMKFLASLRKKPEQTHKLLDYVTRFLIGFSDLLTQHGVTVIAIADPTATGEILGPAMFKEYAVRYLKQVVVGVHKAGVPAIVHICGNVSPVKSLLPEIGADAISLDAIINLSKLKAEFPTLITMGNVSTYLLEFGPTDKIREATMRLVKEGVDIIAPACGLSTTSSVENIKAMTAVVADTDVISKGGENYV